MKRKSKLFSGRSLFLKYMNVSVLIVFVSFLVLGIVLTMTISNYWSTEKKNTLDRRAEYIAEYVSPNIKDRTLYDDEDEKFQWLSRYYTNYLTRFLRIYSKDANVDIYITDLNGSVMLAFPGNREYGVSFIIAEKIVDSTLKNHSYFEKGTMGGVYADERFISARPITNDMTGESLGLVIVTTDTRDIENFTDMVLKIFLLSAIATLSMSVLAMGLFSYNMIKPLRQMSQAAKQFGKGDFSVRINFNSNDEIGELAVAFNNMAESLAASEMTRKSFVANVSHELKTPMTTIAGFIDGILDGTIPEDRQKYYLHIVTEEVKRLSRLVRSMLDLSRIDSGELKLNYQKFDLLDTLVTIIITFEHEIERKNIDIRGLDRITPKPLYGDKDLLHQVVYNLIENAVKFTNQDGYIEFDMDESADMVNFVVRNSGMGIKDSEIEMVFDRFYKTDKSRSQDKKGLGLGLYLVRSIIRMHGGDISAKSEYGQYTEFRFYLPRKQKKPEKKKEKEKNLLEEESSAENTGMTEQKKP